MPRWFLTSALVLLASTRVDAEEFLRFEGVRGWDLFGSAVASGGDVDSDGVGDLLAGAYGTDGLAGRNAGSVRVASGRDGTLLYFREGEQDGDWFGWAVSFAGDADQDGVDDFAVGAPRHDGPAGANAGRVYLFSGASGILILTFDGEQPEDGFGTSISSIGDADGDGFDDLLVGAPGHDGPAGTDAGRAYVLSGLDGTPIRLFDGPAPGARFGRAVCGLGDLDGDAIRDAVIGAPGHDGPAGAGAGLVLAAAGADGSPLRVLEGTGPGDAFGFSVAVVPDLDGDGRDEILVGAPTHDGASGEDSGAAILFDPSDGTVLFRLEGQSAGDEFGYSVAGGGDADADGLADWLVGAPRHDDPESRDRGRAYRISGASGELLRFFDGSSAGDRLGTAVAASLDVDRDGRDDTIAAAPHRDLGAERNVGEVTVRTAVDLPCLRGTVNAAGPGELAAVLTINGATGDVDRVIRVPEGETVTAMMSLPPAGGNGRYCVHADLGAPASGTPSPLPSGIGVACFEMLIPRGATPLAVWNGLGKEGSLGASRYFDGEPLPEPVPAPSIFLFLLDGDVTYLPAGTRITLQGIVVDPGSASAKGASVTNAVVLDIQ